MWSRNYRCLSLLIFLLLATRPVYGQDNSSIDEQGYRALQLIDQGQQDKGIALLADLVNKFPNKAIWRMNYGNLLFGNGFELYQQGLPSEGRPLLEESQIHLFKAIELFQPNDENILISECYYLLGEIQQFAFVDEVQARKYYEQAMSYYDHPRAGKALGKLK